MATNISSWATDEPRPTVSGVCDKLINESHISPKLVARASDRLKASSIIQSGNNEWIVYGHKDFNDSFPIYTVSLSSDNHYQCSCYSHWHGENRQSKLCSHVVAVIIARRTDTVRIKPHSESFALTPQQLDLPRKFQEFRQIQLDALRRIHRSDKKFILLQAPTGSGKTLIVAAVQKLLGTKMTYICFTKQLQDQMIDDFRFDLHGHEYAVELKGRQNYPTLQYPDRFPEINASFCVPSERETHCRWCCDGHCEEVGDQEPGRCNARPLCPYMVQKRAALKADLSVLNFDIFVNEANFVGQFSDRQMIVVDEADLIESGIVKFVELVITSRWIQRLGITPPEHKTVKESWIKWAETEALPAANAELDILQNAYGVEDRRREHELQRMIGKLKFFLSNVGENPWVFMPEDGKWVFKPVFASRLANFALWRHGARFILMSATIISSEAMARDLNIPRDEIELIDLPSLFPAEHRPIYYQPAAIITHKLGKGLRSQIVRKIDTILDDHPQVKGLIHTTSYDFTDQIMHESQHTDRLMCYATASDRAAALDHFKKSEFPFVLVAPSMDRGVSLDDDWCRFIIVAKIPYMSLGDKQISTRLYSDKKGGQLWYSVNAIRTLVQETGRGVRSVDDWCEIYILDGAFEQLYSTNKYLFPQWWRDALHMPK